jgi:hypothetical protein
MVPWSVLRPFIALLFGLAVAAWSPRALAWVELTVARDDVRVEIDRQGKARVEHRVLLLVSGGPLPSFTMRGVDPDAELESGAFVVSEKNEKAGQLEDATPVTVTKKEAAVGASAVARSDLEITFEGKGISRGRYVVVVRYRTDLLAGGAIVRDGSGWMVRWLGPAWEHGLDTTRAAFVVPMAPTEPKAEMHEAAPGAPDEDDTSVLSTVTRKGAVDTIELVRLYAARGERVVWAFRLDGRALDAGAPPEATPLPSAPAEPSAASSRPLGLEVLLGVFLALFFLIAGAVFLHGYEIKKRAADRGVVPRPLVPLPLALRACLAAAVYLAGAWLEIASRASLAAALLVACFAIFVWYLPVRTRPEARPPGQWLPLRLAEITDRPPARDTGLFVLSSSAGRVALALLVVIAGAAIAILATRAPYHAAVVAAGAAPLFALFATGGRRSLPVDLAVDPIPLLRDVAVRLARARPGVRLVPRVRLPQGQADADEIRLAVVPPDPVAGLRAVEIGCGWALGPGGYLLLPEILLRFEPTSPCASIARTLEASARKAPGRKLDEQVMVFSPKLPSARLTLELALAVVDRVTSAQKRGVTPPAAEPKGKPARERGESRDRRDAA